MSKEVAWLSSDGQIINRAQKTPGEGGVLWQVELPDGEPFGAVLEKADANSVSMFCNMVRDEWDERKEEQEAKARRKANLSSGGEGGPVEKPVPAPETPTSFSENLRQQLVLATDEYNAIVKRERELAHQVRALNAAVEALDAPQDVTEERRSISVEVESG